MIITPGSPLWPKPFLVTRVTGQVSWIDPSDDSKIDNPGGAVTYAIDKSRNLGNVVLDSDMELVGIVNWTNIAGVTTKETGTPHGGSQCLRSTFVGAGTGRARQTGGLAVGVRHRLDGWARGDGTAPPAFYEGAELWAGTSANTWQNAIYVWDASATWFELRKKNTGEGNYAEFDDWTITPSNDAFQGTPANRPTHDQTNKCITYSGASSQRMIWIKPPVGSGTIWGWVNLDTLDTAQSICGSNDGTNWWSIQITTSGALTLLFGTQFHTTSATLGAGAWHFFCATYQAGEWSATIDGTRETWVETETASTRNLMIGCRDNNGTPQQHLSGKLGQLDALDHALSVAEIGALRAGTFRS